MDASILLIAMLLLWALGHVVTHRIVRLELISALGALRCAGKPAECADAEVSADPDKFSKHELEELVLSLHHIVRAQHEEMLELQSKLEGLSRGFYELTKPSDKPNAPKTTPKKAAANEPKKPVNKDGKTKPKVGQKKGQKSPALCN